MMAFDFLINESSFGGRFARCKPPLKRGTYNTILEKGYSAKRLEKAGKEGRYATSKESKGD
jgi:hypothetical protein